MEAMGTNGELTVRVADLSQAGGQHYFRTPRSAIPEDQIEQIFDPSVTTKGQGVSLGLVICRAGGNAHTGPSSAHAITSARPHLQSRISRALDHECRSHSVKTVLLALLG
jgi:C4-dicarboxylate-specific signal transduction histidine kinase